jgi:hypothetical protein
MESSTDLCFGGRKMAAECCNAIHTGARQRRNEAFMAHLLRADSRMDSPEGSGEVAA